MSVLRWGEYGTDTYEEKFLSLDKIKKALAQARAEGFDKCMKEQVAMTKKGVVMRTAENGKHNDGCCCGACVEKLKSENELLMKANGRHSMAWKNFKTRYVKEREKVKDRDEVIAKLRKSRDELAEICESSDECIVEWAGNMGHRKSKDDYIKESEETK
jgi:hypothetical protein